MGLQVQIRKDSDCVEGVTVRIEHAGGSEEGKTGADGFVTFGWDKSGPVTLYVDGKRHGTYDYDQTQIVTIMV
jgi:hypothetical protein